MIKIVSAPTPKTLVDFWRMLWEQNIEHIVILTQLVEGAKVRPHFEIQAEHAILYT